MGIKDTDSLIDVSMNWFIYVLITSLLSIFSSTQSFGFDREVYYRHASAGLNKYSYYFGMAFFELLRLVILPPVFLFVFMIFAKPLGDIVEIYMNLVAVFWMMHGVGQFMSVTVKPEATSLAAT